MTQGEKKNLALEAVTVREDILKSTHSAGSGHPGGSLSAVEYLVYLYEKELRVDPKKLQDPERDRFVLSKGHAAPVLYSVLARKGFFPVEDLLTLRKKDSHLQGHPNMHDTPGIDMSTGSLGQGVSAAVGMALGAKRLGKDIRVYALLGDGEIEEGQVWEAVSFAAFHKLSRLCLAVDVNGLQLDGTTKEILSMEPLIEKFTSFGCHVLRVDGHDFDAIERALDSFHKQEPGNAPTVILLDTVKGKGVSFMENAVGWHGKAPNDEELAKALAELSTQRAAIEEAR